MILTRMTKVRRQRKRLSGRSRMWVTSTVSRRGGVVYPESLLRGEEEEEEEFT